MIIKNLKYYYKKNYFDKIKINMQNKRGGD
jgi:hypothetical protein